LLADQGVLLVEAFTRQCSPRPDQGTIRDRPRPASQPRCIDEGQIAIEEGSP
jgi:hypothetical protein